MELSEAQKGLNVRYIPLHANGDVNHKDCENGMINSWNEKFIFVRYIRNGILNPTAEATDPSDLIIW